MPKRKTATRSNRAGSASSLATFLKNHITKLLLQYQDPADGGGRVEVFGTMLDSALNPLSSPFGLANSATTRMDNVAHRLKDEYDARNVGPWAIPRLGAVWVEWTVGSCAAFWFARGEPSDAHKLRPEVEQYVDVHVKILLSLLGAKYA